MYFIKFENSANEQKKRKIILRYFSYINKLNIQIKNHMANNSVSFHRVLKASPEKVYRAFTEALAIASWLPPYGFLCTVHQMDARVDGTYKMSFTNFTTGNSHSFGGKYMEMKSNEFLKYTDKFDDPNMPGEMITTVWLKKVLVGTEIKITQEGIPEMIPVEMCYLGWQESLEKLTKLVEPVIPDGSEQ
jgi:uncharacterized protein YndB with AHSA1/START domain